MKKRYLAFILCCFTLASTSLLAQTIQQARTMFDKEQYDQAKPIFQKYVKSQPQNGNYHFWYGVCCLKTGEPQEAVKHLEDAVKKRIPGAQLYLGQAYNSVYRFEDAEASLEEYVDELTRRKKPTDEAEKLLEKSRSDLRMLKGVEDVTVIDSFVVDKARFLNTYKISEESGKLFTYDEYFKTNEPHPGTVYETELGNKLYYSDQGDKTLKIYSKNRLLNEWGPGKELPSSINNSGNTNYPYVLADGVTIYYANDGEGLGGYDIYVTRYNINTDTYMTPENVGMPFNSPYNDYMYVIDEYNNLGWFASDRFQPDGKVCIYVFIPNSSKQIYNYENMEPEKMIRLAKLQSLKETWKDNKEVSNAKERLAEAINHKPKAQRTFDFEFVIDDRTTYNQLSDFKSKEAQQLFQKYRQLQKDFRYQENKLDSQRTWYGKASQEEKSKSAPAIIDLEKRVQEMYKELSTLERKVRNTEKTNL